MTEISLRSYTRDIDRLIEQEKLDEAIAHCRHILQTYPKYIECYRLLGKAYLEAKRYGDAADIFQRVLSAVPDDFVSHIGMSIVREDEGNLDSSIWHMERSFETNPANPALQQELKRLIGRRDGFEPHKVRLTRGALARMYAHGELYPQAIAELHSALQEETDRPDLQVLLTEMYWQTEQRTEAAEVAGQILEKLPFCLKALRITAAVLQEQGKLADAAAYHRRLAQLDPYLAFIEMPMAESTRVEADTIELERLSWQPGQPLPAAEGGPADWATSLGLDEEGGAGPGTGPLPSWLSDIETEEEAEEPQEPTALPFEGPDEPAAVEAEPGAEIPDWMQEAGWSESTGKAQEGPVSFSPGELDSLERGELPTEAPDEAPPGDLAPAEIPDWLREKAPDQDDEAAEDDEAELASILGASLEEEPETPSETKQEAKAAASEPTEVPAWLDEGEPGATSTIMTWLGNRESEGEEPASQAADELPDWIQETTPDYGMGAESPPSSEGTDEEVPSWLSGVAQAAAEAGDAEEQELEQFRQQISPEMEEEPAPSQAGDVPDWLQAITGEEPERPEPAEEVEFATDSGTESGGTQPAPEAQAPVPESEMAPDWLSGLADEGTEPPADEVPAEDEWLAGIEEEDQTSIGTADEAASWLEELGSDESAVAAQESSEPIPNWMAGLDEEIDEPTDSDVEGLASTWLEGLSETLAETPAEPTSTGSPAEPDIPDWLGEISEAKTSEVATPQTGPEEQDQFGPAAGEEEDLSWLTDLESQVGAVSSGEEELAPAAADLEDLDEDGIFNWLDQLATQQDAGESLADGPITEGTEKAAELSETPPPESLEEGLEWLDRLSESRGIDADISRQPAAGTPSEGSEPSTEEPGRPSAEFAAEEFNVWEPEEPEETEPVIPSTPEPSESEPDFEDEEKEQPPTEVPSSIFDEPIEEDTSAPPEPAQDEPVEELYTGEEIDFDLAPAPDPIFTAQGDEGVEAPEPSVAEPMGSEPEAEPAPIEEAPISETVVPPTASEEEEVPEWLKAHFDSAAVVEEEEIEPEPVEPEPSSPQAVETVEPEESAAVPEMDEPEPEMPEPARAAERGSDMTADEAMVEEEPIDQVTAAPKPVAAQPTPPEPVEPEEPEFIEAPDQPELGEEADLEPEPELEAT
ncbi:MAG: tetratricopeptide repeat protein, partial [Anaerolineales bacterium]